MKIFFPFSQFLDILSAFSYCKKYNDQQQKWRNILKLNYKTTVGPTWSSPFYFYLFVNFIDLVCVVVHLMKAMFYLHLFIYLFIHIICNLTSWGWWTTWSLAKKRSFGPYVVPYWWKVLIIDARRECHKWV